MRDKIKKSEYFDNCILYEQNRIDEFTEALNSLDKNNKRGIENANIFLSGFYRNLFKLKYSAGIEINKIFDIYVQWIKYYKNICTENDSLYDLVDIFAIGVFFENAKDEYLCFLLEIFNKCNITDGLIICFLRYLQGAEYQFIKSDFDYFNELYNSNSKETQLKKALFSWYQSHNDAYWFDSHKSKNDTYCGYWSFEAGALAKILNIPDDELKDTLYYPYDLVHYKG